MLKSQYGETKIDVELDNLELKGIIKFDKKYLTELRSVRIQREEIKSLVDLFYQTQAARIATENRIRALEQGFDEENYQSPTVLKWDLEVKKSQEKELFKVLDAVTDKNPVGAWLKQITGIGPVLAAGVLAYLDVRKANYGSNFISYAGLNDNNRPWLGKEKATKIVDEILGSDDHITNDHLIRLSAATKWKVETLEEACTETDDNGNWLELINKTKLALIISKKETLNNEILPRTKISTELRSCNNYESIDNKLRELGYREEDIFEAYDNSVEKDSDGNILYRRSREKLRSQISKIPYNKQLKVLLYKISECFVKVNNNPNSLYGKLYKEFKALEIERNNNGEFKDQCEEILKSKNFSKETEAYKAYIQGKLPDAHINARAKRKVQKIFVYHVFEAMWWSEYGTEPPVPYVFGEMGHNDYIGPEVPYPKKIIK